MEETAAERISRLAPYSKERTQNMKSLLKEIGPVTFPENTGERVYMLPFTANHGLPSHLSRWQPTIDAMLCGVFTDGPIYLMIDQGRVTAGKSHRRGGPHIDGNWNPGVFAHDGPPVPPQHAPWPPSHRPMAGHHGHRAMAGKGSWASENFAPEALILASDVCASCVYIGEVEGDPVEGGDCSHLDLSAAYQVPLLAGRAYAGNVTMIHESLPVTKDCQRTLVRLNVPGWEF